MAEASQEVTTESFVNELGTASSEGSRMRTLRNVMNKTVKSFTNNLRLVGPMSSVRKEVLKKLQKDIIMQLEENIMCELDQMYSAENIECLLNGLDRLMEQSGDATPAWRPAGDQMVDSCAHVVVLKREKMKVLQSRLGELEAQNNKLVDRVQRRHTQILNSGSKIVSLQEDLTQIIAAETKCLDTVAENFTDNPSGTITITGQGPHC